MILKMNISATFVVAYIQVITLLRPQSLSPRAQAMEVFPTSVRQLGIGFCSFISQVRTKQ